MRPSSRCSSARSRETPFAKPPRRSTYPQPLPEEWRPSRSASTSRAHFGTVIRLEWLDGKLTAVDPAIRTGSRRSRRPTTPDVFLIEPGVRESGELARFERGADGRVVSLLLAVATYRRLEPVSG